MDPDQQVFGQTRDLGQWIERQDEYAYGRLVAALFTGFSVLALALAAIGFSALFPMAWRSGPMNLESGWPWERRRATFCGWCLRRRDGR